MTDPVIVSVCRDLPGPNTSSGGIFVLRRLAAMARLAPLTTLQPIPWFPVVAPLADWARNETHSAGALEITHAPMFYVPKYLKSLDGHWLYRSIRDKLDGLARAPGVRLVDAHFGYPEGVGAVRAARERGLPVFVTFRGLEVEYLDKPGIGDQMRSALAALDGCICVSHSLRDVALANGANPDTTRVIHNAIDTTVFHPGERAAARATLGIAPDATLIISVGSQIRRKRHHVLIEAFARLRETRPEAELLIVGGESYEPDYPPCSALRCRSSAWPMPSRLPAILTPRRSRTICARQTCSRWARNARVAATRSSKLSRAGCRS